VLALKQIDHLVDEVVRRIMPANIAPSAELRDPDNTLEVL
jgi:hypothetical protein